MSQRRKCWSKSFGDRGHRVRIYEQRPGGPLHRSVRINGKEDRKSLGHRDKELAARQAYELVASLLAHEAVLASGRLTLGILIREYLKSPQHAQKKGQTQRQDARNLQRIVGFFGPTRRACSLCESDVLAYAAARRTGDASLVGIRPGRPVRERTIQADLVSLMTALRWATHQKSTSGRRLLLEHPLVGVKLPREKNPVRPVMTHDEYEALLGVSSQIDPMLETLLVVAEATGRRISAIRSLRWSDVHAANSEIRWRADADKSGYEDVRPAAPHVIQSLLRLRRRSVSVGDTHVFQAPRDSQKAISRHLMDSWLRRAYKLAGLEPKPGGLWHPIRRRWVTERPDYPTKAVAEAGGWRDERTMVRSYQMADQETMRRVIENPTHRLRAAK